MVPCWSQQSQFVNIFCLTQLLTCLKICTGLKLAMTPGCDKFALNLVSDYFLKTHVFSNLFIYVTLFIWFCPISLYNLMFLLSENSKMHAERAHLLVLLLYWTSHRNLFKQRSHHWQSSICILTQELVQTILGHMFAGRQAKATTDLEKASRVLWIIVKPIQMKQ